MFKSFTRFSRLAAVTFAATTAVAALAAPGARAQDSWPSKTVRLVVPYAAGGLPDTTARIIGEKLQSIIGKSVIVENKPGASGGVAVSTLASSPADGHVVLLTEGSINYNALIVENISYDRAAIRPVVQLARAPQFLAINATLPVNSLEEFIAYVQGAGKTVSYGSAGFGSPHHLAMEAVKAGLGLNMKHVPYKGSSEAVPALVGGHVDALWSAYPPIAGFVKNNEVKLVAINSPQPLASVPDVPPMAKLIPGFDTSSILGLYVAKGTPDAIVSKIEKAALEATRDPAVAERLATVGIQAAGAPKADFASALEREFKHVQTIVTNPSFTKK
ncbi:MULTISPECIES: tripartite tricarboxylate transporter substrate binding protein [Neorhizobium]|uniref:Bug family tripartite tricarboxylate transporter substrate binding protein n=1 Tax=Neorhizobium TaxID=1525371 RepID=UPI000CFA71F7|nr:MULTISPECIES: tripartite tricarboxylate transporter substrate binding protein [Neorhizobium]